MRLYLMQMGGNGSISLSQLVDFPFALLDEQTNFLQLRPELIQLGMSFP